MAQPEFKSDLTTSCPVFPPLPDNRHGVNVPWVADMRLDTLEPVCLSSFLSSQIEGRLNRSSNHIITSNSPKAKATWSSFFQ